MVASSGSPEDGSDPSEAPEPMSIHLAPILAHIGGMPVEEVGLSMAPFLGVLAWNIRMLVAGRRRPADSEDPEA